MWFVFFSSFFGSFSGSKVDFRGQNFGFDLLVAKELKKKKKQSSRHQSEVGTPAVCVATGPPSRECVLMASPLYIGLNGSSVHMCVCVYDCST